MDIHVCRYHAEAYVMNAFRSVDILFIGICAAYVILYVTVWMWMQKEDITMARRRWYMRILDIIGMCVFVIWMGLLLVTCMAMGVL